MTNTFTIKTPDNDLLISVQWENSIDPETKKKAQQIILTALELWDSKEAFLKAAEEAIKKTEQP